MAIAFRAAAGDNPSSSTTSTITLPGTIAAGDLMIMAATINAGSSNSFTSGPSGWTSLGVSTDASQLTGVWYKIATSSESNPTVTCANSGKWVAVLSSYSGVDGTTPISDSTALDSPGTANSWTMPNMSPAAAGWRVDVLGQRSSTPATAWTAPSGMTSRNEQFNTSGGASYIIIADSAADVGPGSVTGLTYSNNGSTTSAAAFYSMILKPAGSPPPSAGTVRRWNGSAHVTGGTMKRWNGSAWVTGGTLRRWGGSAWVPAP